MFRPIALGIALLLPIALTAADLSGLVVAEHDGSPVAAAAITLRTNGKVVAELDTNDAGLFRATGLAAAEYVVTATKASFTTAERTIILTDAGGDAFLQITKLGVISGRVTDNQGNPVRNIVVAAVPAPTDGGPLRLYSTRPTGAVTDASGRYRLFGLTAGDYMVVALAGNARSIANVPNGATSDTSHGSTAEFYPSSRSPRVFSIRSGEQHNNIDFQGYSGPLFTIRGNVVGPGPDSPYRLSLVAEVAGIPLASATAQPGKEFQFDRVAPGTYKIVATRVVATGMNNLLDLINSGQIVVTSANEATILRELEAARAADTAPNPQRPEPTFGETIVNVSQDLNGVTLSAHSGVDAKLKYQPASGCPSSVQLTLNPIDYMGTVSIGKKLEEGTEVPLTGIPSATYSVALNLPSSSSCYAATSLIDFRQVSAGATVPIVAAKMGQIQGKVDTAGSATDDFAIVLISPDGITRRTFPLARDSSFSIPNVQPDRYRVSVNRRSATRVVAAEQNVIVESGMTAQVEFPTLP